MELNFSRCVIKIVILGCVINVICDVCEINFIDLKTQNWFISIKNDKFDLKEILRSGQSSDFDEDGLKALLKEDGHQTTEKQKN